MANETYAMPTDGPTMPEEGKFKIGVQSNMLFEKQMKRPKGEVESEQYFSLLSYAPSGWFCLDFRTGWGSIKFKPEGSDTINYNTAFAGGYGFRAKVIDGAKYIPDILWGFQHISVHPDPRKVNEVKHEICMDDWQVSVICAKKYSFFYPYAAVKYSKAVLTRITSPENERKRSGSVDRVGLAIGSDFSLGDHIVVSIEGRLFDEQALNANLSWRF
ncbi:MAG: hypothetical protein V2A72_08585 [Candidatus Omnitrophota bacterium]